VGVFGLYFLIYLLGPGSSLPKPSLRVKADLSVLKQRLRYYQNRKGVYPGTGQWQQALGAPSIKDPWGNEYTYRYPGTRNSPEYDLFSVGPDGLPDTADDDWGQ
jgi:hypothetical protein